MTLGSNSYPASLKIDYPKKLDRLTSFFRILMIIPIFIILTLLTGGVGDFTDQADSEIPVNSEISTEQIVNEMTNDISTAGIGVAGGLFIATLLMILFRQRYPRWWFIFNLELQRFTTRVTAYLLLLTDKYPSTEDEQTVHLDIKYPDAKKDLNRWLPLIKWLLAIPHYIVLFFIAIGVTFAVIIAWFAILFTGRYPQGLFNFVVGAVRWNLRVSAYAFLLTTDKYPPFSLK